jgi:tRNA(Ile)-lysidine synthase
MDAEAAGVNELERAVANTLDGVPRVLLAVSGGRDSMVLLDTAFRVADDPARLLVATYDHGTGAAAREAAALVARESARRSLPFVIGRTSRVLTREAEWRDARWSFLRELAARESSRVATAHTRDDQLETVVIRVLRGTGARGLAGLYARSETLRPFLHVPGEQVALYARERGISFVEDPSNWSRAHLRNRVRLDFLPAVAQMRPNFASEMLRIARRAAEWREELDAIVDGFPIERLNGRTLRVADDSLRAYDAETLQILWPAIAARIGVTMDRRGTERAAAFTMNAAGGRGRVIQVSGGVEIERVRGGFVLRRR